MLIKLLFCLILMTVLILSFAPFFALFTMALILKIRYFGYKGSVKNLSID